MLGKLKTIAREHGYTIYDRPYELNIWGIRSKQTRSNAFDDHIHVFYKTSKGNWEYHIFRATTDPGTYWLNNPMMPQGSAILAQGQYVHAYEIGIHRGKYAALVQRRKVTVIRDYNRDSTLDFLNGRVETGLFGINIHRALIEGVTRHIDKHSAGCQVFENASDFYKLMQMAERHRSLYGNSFTYTLVDERAIHRSTFRRALIGTLAVTSSIAACYYLLTEMNKESITNQQKQIT
jgi:hypothetical protein